MYAMGRYRPDAGDGNENEDNENEYSENNDDVASEYDAKEFDEKARDVDWHQSFRDMDLTVEKLKVRTIYLV